jgi:hypothetical protein
MASRIATIPKTWSAPQQRNVPFRLLHDTRERALGDRGVAFVDALGERAVAGDFASLDIQDCCGRKTGGLTAHIDDADSGHAETVAP